MRPQLLVKLLPAVLPGTHEIGDLARSLRLPYATVAATLRYLSRNEVGSVDDSRVSFDQDARMKAAIVTLKQGGDIQEVSKHLIWQDFEELVAAALEANGYTVRRNVRVRKPRIEIDVLGVKDTLVVAVDCKHWKRTVGGATIEGIALQQLRRVKSFVKAQKHGLQALVPVVVTLHAESMAFARGVPIVPIYQFQDFLGQLPGLAKPVRIS